MNYQDFVIRDGMRPQSLAIESDAIRVVGRIHGIDLAYEQTVLRCPQSGRDFSSDDQRHGNQIRQIPTKRGHVADFALLNQADFLSLLSQFISLLSEKSLENRNGIIRRVPDDIPPAET